MKNDIEKIRVAVLAYCEEVCPNDDETFGVVISGLPCTITGRHHHGIADFDIRETGFFKRRIYQIRSSDDGNWWHLYYIFLGLETRDAVEAYKASLQSDLKSMTSIVASVKNGEQPDYVHISKITELESRNAALVVALEEIRKPAMIISLGKATNRDRAEQLTEDHKRVRMIAQSALTTNTEKGGVNGEV